MPKGAGYKRGPFSEETRKKMSLKRIGIKFTDEHRKHLSESKKLSCSRPEFKEKMSKIMVKMWKDPQIREKIMDGSKRYYQGRRNNASSVGSL